jgi:hypothetical protein
LPARDALSTAAVLCDDPASAFSHHIPTRASADLREATSPLRFFALRMRCGEARCRTLLFASRFGDAPRQQLQSMVRPLNAHRNLNNIY